MMFDIVMIAFFFIIMISLQYTLNKILSTLKEINIELKRMNMKM